MMYNRISNASEVIHLSGIICTFEEALLIHKAGRRNFDQFVVHVSGEVCVRKVYLCMRVGELV